MSIRSGLVLVAVAIGVGLLFTVPDVGLRLFYVSAALGATITYRIVRGLDWYTRRIASLILWFVLTSIIFGLLIKVFVR
jgi:hypothetical protein